MIKTCKGKNMAKKTFDWKYGKNAFQKYYEAQVKDAHLCVFANDENPDVWFGVYDGLCIYDKTFNDRQRKKLGLEGCSISLLPRFRMLTSNDPEYMMRKVEHCFKTGKQEVSK